MHTRKKMNIAIISSDLHRQQIKVIQKKNKVNVYSFSRKNSFLRMIELLKVIFVSFFAYKLFMPRSSSLEYMILNQLYSKKIIGMSDGLLDLVTEIPHQFRCLFSRKIENLKIDEIFKDYSEWINQLDIKYDEESKVVVYYPKKYGKELSDDELRKRLPNNLKNFKIIKSTRGNKFFGTAYGIISHPSTIILQAKLVKNLKIYFIPTLSNIDRFQNERMQLYKNALNNDKLIEEI